MSETQKRACIIADSWDDELLSLELTDLDAADFDLSILGFDDKELNLLLTERDAQEGEDDAPEQAISVPGDVWLLGKHRLMCGDSTVATDVERLLAGVKPHLMVTDPPYGVEYSADWRNDAPAGKPRADGRIVGGGRAIGKVTNADWSEACNLFPGDVAYVWHAGPYSGAVADSLTQLGFALRSQIIWSKSHFAIGRGDYHWGHEPCWYAVRGKGHWTGDRKQSTLWQIDKPAKSETGHSTQKPVECMRRPIVNNSSPVEPVLMERHEQE